MERGPASRAVRTKKKNKKRSLRFENDYRTAPKGDVRSMFSNCDEDGHRLEDGKWRCLHPVHLLKGASYHMAQNGYSNLRKHLLDAHSLKMAGKAEEEEEKKKKKKADASQKTLTFGSAGPSKKAVEESVTKYVISSLSSFSSATAPAFQSLLVSLASPSTRAPSYYTMTQLMFAEEKRLKKAISTFCRDGLVFFSLAGDGRKASIQGRPMYDLTIHGVTDDFDLVSLPLSIAEVDAKDNAATKAHILRVLQLNYLDIEKLISFTGDEAEKGVGAMLACPVVMCGAHRISTCVKRMFKSVGLLVEDESDCLVNVTKSVVSFVKHRYKVRQVYDILRDKANQDQVGRRQNVKILVDYSKTRFLGSLVMGRSFVENHAVLMDVQREAMARENESPWSDLPALKERYFMQWHDACFVTRELHEIVEQLSGERYVTVSEMLPAILLMEARLFCYGRIDDGAGGSGRPLNDYEWRSRDGQAMARALDEELRGKFIHDWKNPVILLAMFLDPRYRSFRYLPECNADDTEVGVLRQLYSSLSARMFDGKPLESRMFSAVIDIFSRKCPTEYADLMEKESSAVKSQVAEGNYSNTKLWQSCRFWAANPAENLSVAGSRITMSTDPLLFWRECNSFEWLRKLAKMVLGAPASAISCERLWSAVAKVIDKSRASLKLETGASQVYVRSVWQAAEAQLQKKNLSAPARRFFETLQPFGK